MLNEGTIEKWQSEAEPFQIVFLSKMEYNETMNILPRLRLRYGRNLSSCVSYSLPRVIPEIDCFP